MNPKALVVQQAFPVTIHNIKNRIEFQYKLVPYKNIIDIPKNRCDEKHYTGYDHDNVANVGKEKVY